MPYEAFQITLSREVRIESLKGREANLPGLTHFAFRRGLGDLQCHLERRLLPRCE